MLFDLLRIFFKGREVTINLIKVTSVHENDPNWLR